MSCDEEDCDAHADAAEGAEASDGDGSDDDVEEDAGGRARDEDDEKEMSKDSGVLAADATVTGRGDASTSGLPNDDADGGEEAVDIEAPGEGSAGCGAADDVPTGPGTIDVDGTERSYIIATPENYDPQKRYKLVYAWHGLGGTAASIARSWYGLEARAMGSTIFIAGQGLPGANGGGAGWPNSGGRDVAFVKALHERVRATYCIDEERVFSVGMSYGGIMSNTLGCQMGDVFRAIAPIAGSGPRSFGRGMDCTGQVAAWLAHGNEDTVVTFQSGQGSRDHWLAANHCETQTMPTEPSPCVTYQGCDAEHPVHWCEFDGGHTVPRFASAAIWSFFSQF